MKSRGFTLIELIIVIFVIGVLASIVLVAYPGYQQRTRDNQRKSDLQQVSAAINAYALQKNDYVTTASGCGLGGNGNGWLNAGPSDTGAGSYPQAITACLQGAGVLTAGSFVDPSGCNWGSGGSCGTNPAQAYMKATCTKNGNTITYLFAHTELDPPNAAAIDALCDSGSVNGFTTVTQKWGTAYGMNYYVVVR
jgi:prepilin-type N-terminal cleavage/methylation domain-containing protein